MIPEGAEVNEYDASAVLDELERQTEKRWLATPAGYLDGQEALAIERRRLRVREVEALEGIAVALRRIASAAEAGQL